MKNVAIVTCIGKSNFGNRLQNYALAQFIKKNNIDVSTIRIKNKVNFPFLELIYI